MRRQKPQRQYYFSEKLKQRLTRIPFYPLTVVEAPAGFGKTTAVREFLKENLPPDAREFWYTCLGEPAAAAWGGICELFSHADPVAAVGLRKLDMPTRGTLVYLKSILRGLCCEAETYLVIDNYQRLESDILPELVRVFSLHGCPRTHIVLITQEHKGTHRQIVLDDNIHVIDPSDLLFDREGTAGLLKSEGIRLSDSELESFFASTDGWVSAIRLQITNFRENGTFDYNLGIEHLVEAAIWNLLEPEEKDFLLAISVLESFTARQAAMMLGQETLPEEIEDTLKSSDFIRYFPKENRYIIHSILRDFLQNRFCQFQSAAFQKQMLHRAGESYAAVGEYYSAAQYFLKVGDFDALFSLPFTGEYLQDQREKALSEFIAEVTRLCPEETLCRYPTTLLHFAYNSLLAGNAETFQRLCRLLRTAAEGKTGLPEAERRQIQGELALLESLTIYNDVKRVNEKHREAWELLGSASKVLGPEMPYTFGNLSPLCMFWREPGTLVRTLQEMKEVPPYYRRLTRGHGAGIASLLEAEILLERGEDRAAESLCHEGLYYAQSFEQTSLCISACLLFILIASLRGDAEEYLRLMRTVQGYASGEYSAYTQRMVDLCQSFASLTLGITEDIAGWLCNLETVRKTLYAPAVPFAQIIYAKLLLLENRCPELYGISQPFAETANAMHCMLPQLYLNIHLAVAKHSSGDDRAAQDYVNRALAMALPDQVYLPFALQKGVLYPFLETAKQIFPDREGINKLIALCRRQEKGREAIRKAILAAKSPLTPREREVALCARERLSAKEIAGKLYISEGTVRFILSNVYKKLDIHSKAQLNQIEF